MGNSPHHSATSPHFPNQNSFSSPQHQQQGGKGPGWEGYQDQPDGAAGEYVPDRRQGFQDFPGGEEEQPPQISADLSDIAR